MKVVRYFFTTIIISVIAFMTFTVGRWYKQEFSYVQEKRMIMDGRDTKGDYVVNWPQKGTATILSPKFTIAFEGVSWSEISLIRAQYKVDGRYGGINGPDSLIQEDMGNGVRCEYSPRKREATITFKKYRFIYCDYLNTLRVNGVEYSTAKEAVHLWVSKQGVIKTIKRSGF
jgi:hypothetical protein